MKFIKPISVILVWLVLTFLSSTPRLLADDLPEGQTTFSPPTGGLIGGLGTTIYNFTAAPSAPQIFKNSFGNESIYEIVKSANQGQPRTGNLNNWYKHTQDIYRYYGKDQAVQNYVATQYDLYNAVQTRENALWAMVNDSKGVAGEMHMDKVYSRSGWTKIASQSGRQGIDGLYIKQGLNSDGNLKIMIAESKTGNSSLNNTKYGRQMSLTWIENKLDTLVNSAQSDLLTAKKAGDQTKIEAAQAKLNQLQQIEKQVKNGDFRSTVQRTTVIQVDGMPVLRTEFYKVQKGPSGMTSEVTLSPRINRNGQPNGFDTPLNPKELTRLTSQQRAAYDAYFKGMENQLTEMGVPRQSSSKLVRSLQNALRNGSLKPGINGSLETEFNRHILDNLRNDPAVKPELLEEIKVKQKLANTAKLNRLPHALSLRKAGAIGAGFGGLLAGILEFKATGHITSASFKQAALAGGISVGNALGERSLSRVSDYIANKGIIKRVAGGKFSSYLKGGKLFRAGGVMIVVTEIGFNSFDYLQGNISGKEAVFKATEGTLVGLASIAVMTKAGAALGTLIPVPGVGTVIGTAIGATVGIAYYGIKERIIGKMEMDKQLQLQKVFDDIDHVRSLQSQIKEQDKLRTEANSFFDEARKSLADSKSRY